ncbi:PrsW family intramembrane metalloprotease [bacterium]|nr:PrsW family intramembrane metalloprotease [bacterium]
MFRLRHEGGTRAPIALEPTRRSYKIGRSPEAELSFPEDTTLSRIQAEITWNGTTWVLANKSQHGSYVGSAKVEGERALAPGDVIHIGATKLVFEVDPSAAADSAPTIPPSKAASMPKAAPASPSKPAAAKTPAGASPSTPAMTPAPGAVAPDSAGYDTQGVFHMGFTMMEAPEKVDGKPAAPAPAKQVKDAALKRNLIFFAVMLTTAFLGMCCLSFTILFDALSNVPVQFLIASSAALLPTVPYLMMFKFLDRNGQIPWKNFLACFFWGATVGCGFSVVFNTLTGEVISAMLGQGAANLMTTIVAAPFFEESSKGLGVLVVFLLIRDEFDNAVEGMLLGAASGLGFALIENCVYDTRFLVGGGAGTFLALGTFRALTCALIGHPVYTAMTGLGFGLSREMGKSSLRFFMPVLGWCIAVFMHASWNGSAALIIPAVFGDSVLGIVALALVVGGGCALFFFAILIYALVKERRVLVKYLGDEVAHGFIEKDELDGFKSLFGREKFVFGGMGKGTWRLRRELRRAQLDLAFRKWHLDQGDKVKGRAVDLDLLDARTRIRDARNALNAKEHRERRKSA